MKVLLVNPPRFEGLPVIREERCEIVERNSVVNPYSLLQLAAILREEGHEVELLDLNGYDLGYDSLYAALRARAADAVAFRFTPTTFDHDMRTAAIVKEIDPETSTIGICWTLRTRGRQVLLEAPALDAYATQDYEISAAGIVRAL